MATETKIAAIFGLPTELYSYTKYVTPTDVQGPPGDPSKPRHRPEYQEWVLGDLDVTVDASGKVKVRKVRHDRASAPITPVRSRWVYVFVYAGAVGGARLFVELYVDAEGKIQLNPASDLAERLEWRPNETEVWSDEAPPLPRAVAGRDWYFCVVGVPWRLDDDCVDRLTKDDKIVYLVDTVDLSDPKHYELTGSSVIGATGVGDLLKLALPVTCPFDVARRLSTRITEARTQFAKMSGHGDESDGETAGASERLEKYMFARSLADLVKHPDLGSEIGDEFKEGAKTEMLAFVAEFEGEATQLQTTAETIGGLLARWFDRELVQLLLDGATVEDSSQLMVVVDEILAGLGKTAAGFACVTGQLMRPGPSSFLHRNFSGASVLEGTTAQIAQKGLNSFAQAFASVQKMMLFHRDVDARNLLVSVDTVFGGLAPGWSAGYLEHKMETFEQVVLTRDPSGHTSIQTVKADVEVLHGRVERLERLGRLLGHADLVLKMVDTINVCLAIKAYVNTDVGKQGLRSKRGVAAAVAGGRLVGDIVTRMLKGVAETDAKQRAASVAGGGIGLLFCAYDFVSVYETSGKARGYGDYDACAALWVSYGASLLGAGFSFVSSFALGTSWTGGVGAAFSALAGAFYVVYLYVKDSELETLVNHCEWGRLAGRGSTDAEPVWSPVGLRALASSWEHQNVALGALQRQFALGIGPQIMTESGKVLPLRVLRIFVGHIDEDTSFEVTWTWQAKPLPGAPTPPGEDSATWVFRHDEVPVGQMFGLMLRVGAAGEPYFDVRIPEDALRDRERGYEFIRAQVRKQYKAGSKTRLVPPKAPIEITVQLGDRDTNADTKVLSLSED
jgi:hypothetical protein